MLDSPCIAGTAKKDWACSNPEGKRYDHRTDLAKSGMDSVAKQRDVEGQHLESTASGSPI
jgi:hypothetical protein